MTAFDPDLLDTSRGLLISPSEYYAVLNARGLYNSMQFVVRLSPKVHEQLATLPNGVAIADDVSFEATQAFSTYLHETIHWWQHVGSTTGLLLSLSYPGQTHANSNYLKRLIEMVGPKKSVRTFAEQSLGHGGPETPGGRATIVVNNQYDIEAFRTLATNPERAQQVIDNPYFESVGHAYQIAYSRLLMTAASTFDTDLHSCLHLCCGRTSFTR